MAFVNRKKQELEAVREKLAAAEDRVRELEADLQAIERSTGYLALSPDGLIESINDILLDSLGYRREELLGQHHRILCDRDYARSEEYIAFWRGLVTGNPQQGRFAGTHADGRSLMVEARYSPVMSDRGLAKRVITLVTRVTPAPGDA
ncbi:methyl-accepting chemotaxis protein [Marinobacter daqiaonensis]|uniref:Methyl-accepting chemotaxis protein n=1 Tax=Marinobacter daqiaonensis TaxID=650891 RepID=A0A1I6H7N1_9GAMM|nr:PAS domain-containing protein [Marinobacter daqiaonensis]SFR50452.1 methyl-accepting chemotaxis protein [Marinobacter daqiaonensis]